MVVFWVLIDSYKDDVEVGVTNNTIQRGGIGTEVKWRIKRRTYTVRRFAPHLEMQWEMEGRKGIGYYSSSQRKVRLEGGPGNTG